MKLIDYIWSKNNYNLTYNSKDDFMVCECVNYHKAVSGISKEFKLCPHGLPQKKIVKLCKECWNQEINTGEGIFMPSKYPSDAEVFPLAQDRQCCNTCKNLHIEHKEVVGVISAIVLKCKGNEIQFKDHCEGWNK